MSQSIGSWALELVADPTNFLKNLKNAENGFAMSLARMNTMSASELGKGLSSAITGFVSSIPTAFNRPVQDLADTIRKIPKLGGALAVPLDIVQGTLDFFQQEAQRLTELQMAARRAGLEMDQLRMLQLALGPAAEGLDRAMAHLNSEIGKAGFASMYATTAFDQLGIRGQELASMDKFGALKVVTERLGLIQNSFSRAAIAAELFGRKGMASMLPLIEEGFGKLDEARAKMDKFGLSMSHTDMSAVRSASIAIRDMGLGLEGLKNQAVVGLAPVVMEVAESFTKAGSGAGSFAEMVKDGAGVVLYSLAYIVDTIRAIKDGWEILKLGVNIMADAVVSGMGMAGEAIDGVVQGIATAMTWMLKLPGMTKMIGDEAVAAIQAVADGTAKWSQESGWADMVERKHTDLQGRISEGWAILAGNSSKSAVSWIDEVMAGAEKRMEEMKKRAAGPMPLSQADPELFKRQQDLLESVQTPIQKYRNQMAEVNELFAKNAINAEAYYLASRKYLDQLQSSTKVEFKSPFGKWLDDVHDLNALVMQGAIDGAQYYQSLGQQFASLDKAFSDQMDKKAGAVEAGSKEAYSAMVRQTQGSGSMGVQERMAGILEDMKNKAAKQVEYGKEVADALANLGLRGI